MTVRSFRGLITAGTVGAALAFGAANASAAEITVDALSDGSGSASECELRDAIATANTGSVVDGCETGVNNGHDNIFLTVQGTITLASELTVDTNESISVFGPFDEISTTITGGGTHRIFNASAAIRLEDVALSDAQNASSGGGILSNSQVELYNVLMEDLQSTGGNGGCISAASVSVTLSTLQNNDAANNGGCIYSGASLSIDRSSFWDNEAEDNAGGAVASFNGTLTVADSTFGGNINNELPNVANWGGAIYTESIVDIKRSTFIGNKAENTPALGGAIYNPAGLGGTIANSTFFGNVADANGGSIASQNTALTLRNNTIVSNPTLGADIAHTQPTGTITLANNIIEDYNNALGPNCSGVMNDAGYNVISGDLPGSTCPTGGTNVAQTPLLVTPLNLWGGTTRTFMLQAGSPAVDLIPPANCPLATDQRGADRPDRTGALCDAGAVEVDYLPDGTIAKQGGTAVGDDVYNETGDDQVVTAKVKPGKAAKFTLAPQNDAQLRSDRFLIEGPGGKGKFKVTYKHGSSVTDAVTSDDGYETASAFAGGGLLVPITVKVKALKTAKKGKEIEVPVLVASSNFSTRSDTVRAEVTVK